MEEPSSIKKLDETVINRIAAGEVIQRPANVLKEMIENSLDAKATHIQITLKAGGLKYIQIQDNGTGIRKEDFPIVCERFTTSKLQSFEDLETISTYGFRGEALASISYIAHLSITSKTCNDRCAHKANFVDGRLQGAPTPIAGNQGTIITVEDLFFNTEVRKKALRSPAEEYQKISEIVGKYAIHNEKIGFALRKSMENNDLRTPIDSNAIDNIRTIYGNNIARELISWDLENQELRFKAKGHMSNVNYSMKKMTFVLFINHRLVECNNLKKCIDQVYSTYLPKNSHPFVYVSLELDPITVDVNVHPTKHEVHFLNEDLIIQAVCGEMEAKLLGSNNSRTYYTTAKLPVLKPTEGILVKEDKKKINPKDLVRTDACEQKLEKFYGASSDDKKEVDPNRSLNEGLSASFISKINRVETSLTTVLELRSAIEEKSHRSLREVFSQHVFVGVIDPNRALIQYSTKLFLCNTKLILYEFLYQTVLYNFQNFPCIRFSNEIPIYDLALVALDLKESSWTEEDGDKNELAIRVKDILIAKAEMLEEYFSLEIDETGLLKSLPLLLDNFTPDIGGLPIYILRLATDVNWESEKECFDTFAKETARFYCEMSEESKWESNDWRWVTEHAVYASIKKSFIPPKTFTENRAILEIADLPNLYKVFERC